MFFFPPVGSDFNAAKTPITGTGWQYSDRWNMVQVNSRYSRDPIPFNQTTFFDYNTTVNLAYAGQDLNSCMELPPYSTSYQNTLQNCAVLNLAPNHFDAGLFPITQPGLEKEKENFHFHFLNLFFLKK